MADFLKGSAAETVADTASSVWDALKQGYVNPTSSDLTQYTNELAARGGVPSPVPPVQSAQNYISGSQLPGTPGQITVPVGNDMVTIDSAAPAQAAQPADPSQFEQPAVAAQAVPANAAPQVDFMKQMQGQMNTQKAINNTLADAGRNKAQFEAERNIALAEAAEADLIAQEQRKIERQKQVDTQLAELDKSQLDYKNFLASPEAKVKTNNLWENAGTGQKVLAGISLALGALGAGNTGKNGAVEIITQAIDKDIDAQKTNIRLQADGKLKQYDMQNNVYNRMLQKYSNEDQAEAATRMLRLQQVQSQLNAVAADYTGTAVQQQAKLANVAIDQAMLQQKMQFAAAAQNQALLNGIGTQDPMNMTPAQMAALPKEVREQLNDVRERYVPGYGAAVNKAGATEFQKVRAGAEPVLNAIDRITPLLEQYNRVTDITKRNQIETELKALAGALRLPITGPGALTDDEYKRLRDTIGNPSSLLSLPAIERSKMMQIRKKVSQDLDASAEQYGLPRKNKNFQLKSLGPAK